MLTIANHAEQSTLTALMETISKAMRLSLADCWSFNYSRNIESDNLQMKIIMIANQKCGVGKTPRPAQHVQQTGEVARVLSAVASLSASLRVTLVLATIEELPHKQIAEILDIPEGTVAWRVNEARRLLKQKPAGDEPRPAAAATPATVK